MSSENHLNNSDKEVDEVDAALSDLEITLEGGKTSTILVRVASSWWQGWLARPLLASHQAGIILPSWEFFQASNLF